MIKINCLTSLEDSLSGMIKFDFEHAFVPEVFSSILVVILLCILTLVIYFKAKKALKDPLKTPKGILNIACIGVEKAESFVVSIMGEKNIGFTAYIIPLMCYVFFCFIFGLTGLASPMTYYGVPLSLALVTFIMIHAQAIKTNHWGYFKRYIDPIPVFLPINLVTMWAPLLSMSLRMFGNALSGFCIMGLLYFGLESLSSQILTGVMPNTSSDIGPSALLFAPIATPILHAYFDLFSGFIQTLVFSMLTMINILQEQAEEPDEMIDRAFNQ